MSKALEVLGIASWLLAAPLPAGLTAAEVIALGDLCPDSVRQSWGSLQVDRSISNRPLRIGDRSFARGLGTHATSELVFNLDQPYDRFEAFVGVDAAMQSYKDSSVVFVVLGDGRELFRSDLMRIDTPPRHVSVPLAGVRELKLVVTDAGDGINCDHADWADAVLVTRAHQQEPPRPARFTVASPSVTVRLSDDGEIVGLTAGRFDQAMNGGTRLSGCQTVGPVVAREIPGGGVAFSRKLVDTRKHTCTVTEQFRPTSESIRWDIEILGGCEPWSTPVVTRLTCESPREVRFWTAWSDPEVRGDLWRDPLVPRAFDNRWWHYGNAAAGRSGRRRLHRHTPGHPRGSRPGQAASASSSRRRTRC